MRSGLNTVVFLSIIIVSILVFVGFELFHRSSDANIPAKLIEHAENPLPSSFDGSTLKKIYESKDNYYEYKESNQ
jgi:hypothetical protein